MLCCSCENLCRLSLYPILVYLQNDDVILPREDQKVQIDMVVRSLQMILLVSRYFHGQKVGFFISCMACKCLEL